MQPGLKRGTESIERELRDREALPARHELKFYINQGDAVYLACLLDRLMQRDKNADEWGNYTVRSLYFDDMRDAAFYDKINGVRERDKYRIRIYNYSEDTILLERKTKVGDGIAKASLPITRDMAEQIIAGDTSGLETHSHELVRDVFRMMKTRLLAPVVLVDYIRQAYTYPLEHVRVTFDKCLHTGLWTRELFNESQPTLPVPDVSTILEVKYDRILPEFLKPLLASIDSTRSAISKYTLCRGFEPFS